MKKKGFTLIELLAVIVILGVIMIIAIPSVTSYITNARKDSYISDAKMFVNAAKTKLTADATLPQEAGAKVIVPISDIALDKGGEKSPYGNDWDYENSFVVVENQGTSSDPNYVWQVALNDIKNNCIPLTAMSELRREDVGTNCNIVNPLAKTLYATIIEGAVLDNTKSTYVSSTNGIDFVDPPSETNGQGIYIKSGTENNTKPIYYFRGDIYNNNVIFAGYCWQIVRTTETGGIKMIFNGYEDNGECWGEDSSLGETSFNVASDDNAYVGYMYGTIDSDTYEETHANINSSLVKDIIDEWYEENLLDYTEKLEDTVWCNDRSFASYNTGTGIAKSKTDYAANERISNRSNNPVVTCQNWDDKFTVDDSIGNGELTYPIGLLTADEVTLAGISKSDEENYGFLIRNADYWWWLGTPDGVYSSGNAYIYLASPYGFISEGMATWEYHVRPAISLKVDTTYIDGDGSEENPYIVE